MREADFSREKVEPKPTFEFLRFVPQRFRGLFISGVSFAALGALVLTAEACDNSNEPVQSYTPTPQVSNEVLEPESFKYIFPVDRREDTYYTGGPHDTVNLYGPLEDAVDFSFGTPLSCYDANGNIISPPPVQTDRTVVVAGDGKVIRNDSGIVEIEDDLNILGYEHLANAQIAIGDIVHQGEVLGNPSCIIVKGGEAKTAHLHFFRWILDKVRIPIEGFVLSGWTIKDNPGAKTYNGFLVNAGKQIRTADVSHCGPSPESITACGLRNDLAEGDILAVSARPKTIAPTLQPTAVPAPKPTAKPELSDSEKKQQEIEAKMQQAEQLTQQFIDLLKAGGEQNIQAAFNMQLPQGQENILNHYSLATLATLRICSDEMIEGEMQDIRLNRRFIPDPNKVLSEADKLNQARGLLPRDVYSHGVTFLLNDWNSSAEARIGFKEYGPVKNDMVVGFEDVNGQMLITQPKLCTAIGGPLDKTVYQFNSGQ